jgi:hypothetical protein
MVAVTIATRDDLRLTVAANISVTRERGQDVIVPNRMPPVRRHRRLKPMSAFGGKADINGRQSHVRF